jgi:hypothetical protein
VGMLETRLTLRTLGLCRTPDCWMILKIADKSQRQRTIAAKLFVPRAGVEVAHTVRPSVASCTQRDQVHLGIFAGVAAELSVVDP